jgi:von Willebrand factor type A domain
MMRPAFVSIVAAALGLAGCGPSISRSSVCDAPGAPPECAQTCSGGADTCPAGFHCGTSGTCDAECTPGGGQCGAGETCNGSGQCVPGGTDGGGGTDGNPGPDADCPAIHFTPTGVTPSVEILIDGSTSMDMTDISPDRYTAVRNGLVGTNGVVNALQSKVYFGAAIFSSDNPCPTLAKQARALDNASAIQQLIDSHSPNGLTPTAPSIDAVVADFAANPPPTGSPPIIVLATDGEPNGCGGSSDGGASVTAAQDAHTAGIDLYILGLAGLNTTFLQDMANAGVGIMPGQPDAPYYTANDPTSLQNAFNTIIGGVLSCDLTITGGTVDTSQASSGTVTLNGVTLVYGTDWILKDGMTIELIGAACDELKNSSTPVIDASFPCGVIVN